MRCGWPSKKIILSSSLIIVHICWLFLTPSAFMWRFSECWALSLGMAGMADTLEIHPSSCVCYNAKSGPRRSNGTSICTEIHPDKWPLTTHLSVLLNVIETDTYCLSTYDFLLVIHNKLCAWQHDMRTLYACSRGTWLSTSSLGWSWTAADTSV